MANYHLPFTIYHKPPKGQVMLEFTFCMIVLFLMMYAIIMVFRWTGLDLGQRRVAHDAQMTTAIEQHYGDTCFSFNATCEALWDCAPCGDFGCSSCVGDAACCLVWSTIADGPLKQIEPYFYSPTKMNAVWTGN